MEHGEASFHDAAAKKRKWCRASLSTNDKPHTQTVKTQAHIMYKHTCIYSRGANHADAKPVAWCAAEPRLNNTGCLCFLLCSHRLESVDICLLII